LLRGGGGHGVAHWANFQAAIASSAASIRYLIRHSLSNAERPIEAPASM
jgi:hypothetical protein